MLVLDGLAGCSLSRDPERGSYEQLGVATSAATCPGLHRRVALGTAILGAIFANRLADELAGEGAGPAASEVDSAGFDPSQVRAAPENKEGFISSFTGFCCRRCS